MANRNEDVGDEVVEITGPKKDIWPQNIESCFIGLMDEEVKKGNRQTTTLTRDAWRRIKEELKTQFGKEYTNDQFKNKFNQLRGKWKDFNNILKLESGIGFNASTGIIYATEDEWKKLCDKYKTAKQFKKKGCMHYDKLCVIYGDTTASGENQHPSTKVLRLVMMMIANVNKDTKKRNPRENAQVAFANAMTIFGEHTKKKMEALDDHLLIPQKQLAKDLSFEVLMDVTNESSLLDDSDDEEFLTLVGFYINIEYNSLFKPTPQPQRTSKLKGHEWVVEVLNGHPRNCYETFRMTSSQFIKLCDLLKERNKLKDTRFLIVQEQVAIFLLIICQTVRTRLAGDRFQHSVDTIHRHFKRVLKAICSLSKYFIVPPSFDEVAEEIRFNPRYYPFFKEMCRSN
ncbi:hypothetical protein OROGR_014284 [Orobanche gracilis]